MPAPFNFNPLAGPYTKAELPMMEVVRRDMERGNIEYCIVKESKGSTVYRTSKGWLDGDKSQAMQHESKGRAYQRL